MAFLSAILTALSRKLGDVLQALFGWSVAAMFGRLSSPKTRALVTVAMILALCWPVFVVGVFFPAAATFVIAFVPIENETIRSVLRVIWIALALTAPLIVAMLVRAATPLSARKPVPLTLLGGHPLSLGMFLSFIVTLITVPVTKIISLARRWEDQHIYVQPRKGRYQDVLRHLVSACEAASLLPRVEDVPRQMSLSIRVLRVFSRGSIDSFIIERPRRVVCEGLQLYLYPADLLIRGEPSKVAQVRARLTATFLERDAWLVSDVEAQELQDDLCRLWDVLQSHENPLDAAANVRSRLVGVVKEAWHAKKLSFDDWLTLDRIARRLETELSGKPSVIDEISETAKTAPNPEVTDVEAATLPTLVRSLAQESKQLVKLEASLAKVEAEALAASAQRSVIAFGSAIALVGAAVGLGAVAIVMALEKSFVAALVAAGILAGSAILVFVVAYAGFPKSLMEKTRHRLERDWRLITERAS
ncbi:MAG: phage holin family protein [Archangium sp.]